MDPFRLVPGMRNGRTALFRISSFLQSWFQFAGMGRKDSRPRPVFGGVSQGWMLSPLLFNG